MPAAGSWRAFLTMKTLFSAVLLALALSAQAQQQASSKVTAKTAATTLLPKTTGTGRWTTVLENTIKLANNKDIFATVSLECGLFTQTLSSTKHGVPDTSEASAMIEVQLLIDGKAAQPGPVVFSRRTQTLTTVLEGQLAGCQTIATNLDGSLSIVVDWNCVQPESVKLAIDSMNANSFSFVGIDVPVGAHRVSVQARITSAGSAQTGNYVALGTVGRGSMVVESVRLVKDPGVALDIP